MSIMVAILIITTWAGGFLLGIQVQKKRQKRLWKKLFLDYLKK